ncbi:MAG: hypothetical protein FJX52_00295 [Alphaproteobacteria bacterium]|nr:hypothetical protein [Alphaproteobacteria bacterium]
MATAIDTVIFGASYGSLLATKLLLAGHNAHLVCLPAEADLINAEGTRVRMPIKGREGLVEVDGRKLPGKLTASSPEGVDPGRYALAALAMQEPQYRAEGVRQLLDRVARARVPCMSIMNMPPLPYMARIPGLPLDTVRPCYTDPSVWQNFDPALMTLCSPDPQAFRPPEEKTNVLQVRLPTNFKAARFPADAPTAILTRLQDDIERARFTAADRTKIELPVKLKVHQSVFVPMAKWAMLVAGNYRCVQKDAMRPIKDAVHANLAESRAVYDWVVQLCVSLGADSADLVPFEKYANAALSLGGPSSAARALAAGAPNIERVDLLVQRIAAHKGMRLKAVDDTVALVESWVAKNRAKAG